MSSTNTKKNKSQDSKKSNWFIRKIKSITVKEWIIAIILIVFSIFLFLIPIAISNNWFSKSLYYCPAGKVRSLKKCCGCGSSPCPTSSCSDPSPPCSECVTLDDSCDYYKVSDNCEPCQQNTISPEGSNTSCVPCQSKNISNTDHTKCINCPDGQSINQGKRPNTQICK